MAAIANWLNSEPKKLVKSIDYQEFQKHYVVYALKGYRYGQAFCEYFNIPQGTPLYFFKDNNIAERWINDNYLA